MYKRLVLFRNHGITKDPGQMSLLPGGWYYEMQELGYNYRLTDIQAALGLSQFNRINENIASRNQTAIKYYKELACCTGIHLPPRVGDSTSRPMDGNNTHSYHLFPIRLEDDSLRKGLYDFLAQNNIQAQVHYIPVHMQPYYRDYYGYSEGNFPVAEAYYKGEISLPMYHNISDSDVGLVIEKVRQFMEASN
jgi:dTDP-4-amino-4,6-dideoxygalactose transaminase